MKLDRRKRVNSLDCDPGWNYEVELVFKGVFEQVLSV